MPWCPECKTEHREGFTMCQDCKVPLVNTPPVTEHEPSRLPQQGEVLLTVVSNDVEFARVESLMAEAGIPVLKKHRGSGEYLEIYMGVSPYGLEVYVPHGAFEKANALLSGDESVLEPTDALSPELPQEDSDMILESHEEQELHQYMDAVNQAMNSKKKAIATLMLISIVSGLAWSVISILRELF